MDLWLILSVAGLAVSGLLLWLYLRERRISVDLERVAVARTAQITQLISQIGSQRKVIDDQAQRIQYLNQQVVGSVDDSGLRDIFNSLFDKDDSDSDPN